MLRKLAHLTGQSVGFIHHYTEASEEDRHHIWEKSLTDIKNLLSHETEKTRAILESYEKFQRHDISAKEMEKANEDFREMLKAVGLGVFLILPFTLVTIPTMVYMGNQMGIDVLPKKMREKMEQAKEQLRTKMAHKSLTIDEYLAKIPEERLIAFQKLRAIIKQNLPVGFIEEMNYDMIGYVVPLTMYPDGYHANPGTPLPFAHLANQKSHIALYHMGIYSSPAIRKWFTQEYAKHSRYKLDMGKSCVRFKKEKFIPYDLIGELFTKMTLEEWVKIYQQTRKTRK